MFCCCRWCCCFVVGEKLILFREVVTTDLKRCKTREFQLHKSEWIHINILTISLCLGLFNIFQHPVSIANSFYHTFFPCFYLLWLDTQEKRYKIGIKNWNQFSFKRWSDPKLTPFKETFCIFNGNIVHKD